MNFTGVKLPWKFNCSDKSEERVIPHVDSPAQDSGESG